MATSSKSDIAQASTAPASAKSSSRKHRPNSGIDDQLIIVSKG